MQTIYRVIGKIEKNHLLFLYFVESISKNNKILNKTIKSPKIKLTNQKQNRTIISVNMKSINELI